MGLFSPPIDLIHLPLRKAPVFITLVVTLCSVAWPLAEGLRNFQTNHDQVQEQQFQRARLWQQQQQAQQYASAWPSRGTPQHVPQGQNRRQYTAQQNGNYHQQQQDLYNWYWDVQPFLGQNGVMSDSRPGLKGQQLPALSPNNAGRHSAAAGVRVIADKNDILSSGSASAGTMHDDLDEDDPDDDPVSLSTASADSVSPGVNAGSSGKGADSPPEGDPNDLETLVNEYYYVGQKYDTLKTPSQRWVQNYFKNVLPNVVQTVRSRWSAVRKRAGLESALALPVVGGIAAALAGVAGLGVYAYRSRTVVETARKRRSLDDEDSGFTTGESVIRLIELAKEMYDGYDVRSVDCHRRLICQLSKTEAYRRVGADKAFKLAGMVENWVDLPPPLKILMDQLKFAVSFGKYDEAKQAQKFREGRHLREGDAIDNTRSSSPFVYSTALDEGNQLTETDDQTTDRESCELAFPSCDFSFDHFVREKIVKK